VIVAVSVRSVVNFSYLSLFKGGPEPLENEINKILGSKREDRFADHFSDLVQNFCSIRFAYMLRLAFSVRRRGTC